MRYRLILTRAALAAGVMVLTVLVLEVLLRHVPALWPQGVYGVARFSPDLQMTVHAVAPIYTHGTWNRRTPNRDGFLDVEHTPEKPAGVTRIGFFGDSYVEAVQVPLDDTFFRKLPTHTTGRTIEPFGFGISGWGTLHSLLAYRVMGPRYDLDDVVYLFVWNDPGDNLSGIQRGTEPAAAPCDAPPGFVIRPAQRSPDSLLRRVGRFIQEHFVLARLVRVQLTAQRILRDSARQDTAPMPDQNDFPSTWPPAVLADAKLVTRRILAQFRDEVVRDGRRFAVLYVPAGTTELLGRLPDRDSWLPWLAQICAELGIRLLNPRDVLSAAQRSGTEMYIDHWTPAAHALIASFLAGYEAEELSSDSPQ